MLGYRVYLAVQAAVKKLIAFMVCEVFKIKNMKEVWQ